MPSEPEPSSESDNPSTGFSEEQRNRVLDEVREAIAAEDAYRNKLRRERLARERRAAEDEEQPAKPEE